MREWKFDWENERKLELFSGHYSKAQGEVTGSFINLLESPCGMFSPWFLSIYVSWGYGFLPQALRYLYKFSR